MGANFTHFTLTSECAYGLLHFQRWISKIKLTRYDQNVENKKNTRSRSFQGKKYKMISVLVTEFHFCTANCWSRCILIDRVFHCHRCISRLRRTYSNGLNHGENLKFKFLVRNKKLWYCTKRTINTIVIVLNSFNDRYTVTRIETSKLYKSSIFKKILLNVVKMNPLIVIIPWFILL